MVKKLKLIDSVKKNLGLTEQGMKIEHSLNKFYLLISTPIFQHPNWPKGYTPSKLNKITLKSPPVFF